jgi:hypothetical protein
MYILFINYSFSALTVFVVCKYCGVFLRDLRVQVTLGMELGRISKTA